MIIVQNESAPVAYTARDFYIFQSMKDGKNAITIALPLIGHADHKSIANRIEQFKPDNVGEKLLHTHAFIVFELISDYARAARIIKGIIEGGGF